MFPLAGIQAVGSPCSASPNPDCSRPADRLNRSTLEHQCFSFLTHGLAPSTRRSYASAQAKFISLCQQLGKLHPSGSPCPTDEWMLYLFVTFLARTLHHSSIKVYLSGIRALNIDQGFPDPLAEGRSWHQALPVHSFHLTVAYYRRLKADYLAVSGTLDLILPDHVMFWAACSLGYFGFLHVSEFTIPDLSSFSSSLHLSAQDIAVNSLSVPSSMRIRIKDSKTNPFRKRLLHSHWSWQISSLCRACYDDLPCC